MIQAWVLRAAVLLWLFRRVHSLRIWLGSRLPMIGIVALAAVAIYTLVGWRWAVNGVVASIEAHVVTFGLPASFEGYGVLRLQADDLGTATVPRGTFAVRNAVLSNAVVPLPAERLGQRLDLTLPESRLVALDLLPGARLVLRAEPRMAPQLEIHGGAAVGIDVAGLPGLRLSGMAMPELAPEIAGPVVVTLETVGHIPLILTLPAPKAGQPALDIRADLPGVLLRFSRQTGRAEQGRMFQSSIRGGTLRLNTDPREIRLREWEPLRLDDFRGVATSIALGGDRTRIDVVGTVRDARVGPNGLERDLTPTLFGYFATEENYAPLRAILALLIGTGLFEWIRHGIRGGGLR